MRKNSVLILSLCLLLFGASFCSREKKITERGYQKEMAGDKIEAMYEYLRALEINPKYFLANKRMGFLLSVSQNSTVAAIRHLEIAYEQNPEDLETIVKLLDLVLFIQDFERYKEIMDKEGAKIPQEIKIFLENAKNCLQNKENKKPFIDKLITLSPPENTYLFYRCVALCYEKGGYSNLAEEFIQQHRKNY